MADRSIPTDVAMECAEFIDEIIDELQDDLQPPIGRETVDNRGLRASIRRALTGDPQAMQAMITLAQQNGHTRDGDNCPMCQQVAEVMGNAKPDNANPVV